jgi:hypothetical protein
MGLSEAGARRAESRMQERLPDQPRAISVRYEKRLERIVIALSTGLEFAVPVKLAQGLAGARPEDLREIEISPTGLGLHWPRLDADLHLPALLEGVLGSRCWMARRLGKAGGQVRSSGKAAAARANGKRGGRPRKRTDR